ncbi:hypothetical protein N780_11155 [Pontibacillus chungwhensis BH030062]|uniref:DUF503 domain-containing protein n=1 Tax=Pontibacillus chungwhensis BH030062 TaxID=1385513 RepID=A0A0A2UYB5_9BACI|nr:MULTISPECIES: DUF503 family protein [Pontibacillus]KGP92899.1 hypothetical protein N780_11155 [Pontibacillus chungwhensis BH030062]QST01627.1 DUF503 family protein [Pontibacillus sp. ALD_SL1]
MIASVEVECLIYDAHSLKEKRSVLRRILTRAHNEYNVAVAELDHQDVWQRTGLGFVTISSDKVQAEKEINRVLAMIDSFPEIERTTTNLEWL